MELIDASLTDRLLNAAVCVHEALGPGFLESVYEAALAHEMAKRGHKVERQKPVDVRYDGIVVGEHRLDLVADDRVVLELKACKGIEDIHLATARSYLKATRLKVALIINFAQPRIEVRRVVL